MAKKTPIVEDELTPENVESVMEMETPEVFVDQRQGNITRGYRTSPIVPAPPQPIIESTDGEQEESQV